MVCKDEKQGVFRGATLLQHEKASEKMFFKGLGIMAALFTVNAGPTARLSDGRKACRVQPGSSGVIFEHAYASCFPAREQLSLFAQSMSYSSPSWLLADHKGVQRTSQLKILSQFQAIFITGLEDQTR
jgi:hypothetical protein